MKFLKKLKLPIIKNSNKIMISHLQKNSLNAKIQILLGLLIKRKSFNNKYRGITIRQTAVFNFQFIINKKKNPKLQKKIKKVKRLNN